MDKNILNQFRLTVNEKKLGVYGICVYKDGKTVSHRWRSDDKICAYSVSKTFTSTAVGICVRKGILSLEDKMLDFFPEFASDAAKGTEKIRIVDLLHMQSGKDAFWFGGEENTSTVHSVSEDWAKMFIKTPLKWEPGTHFRYSNGCTYMLGRIIEKVTGAKSLCDFLIPELFDILGIHNPQWHTCPGGHTLAATELFLTTEEIMRLGVLWLNKGEYNGRRILDEDYICKATTDFVPTDPWASPESNLGYGYQVWKCSPEGVYRADGMYAQFSIVIPHKNAVVAITSHNEYSSHEILAAVWSDILPQL